MHVTHFLSPSYHPCNISHHQIRPQVVSHCVSHRTNHPLLLTTRTMMPPPLLLPSASLSPFDRWFYCNVSVLTETRLWPAPLTIQTDERILKEASAWRNQTKIPETRCSLHILSVQASPLSVLFLTCSCSSPPRCKVEQLLKWAL